MDEALQYTTISEPGDLLKNPADRGSSETTSLPLAFAAISEALDYGTVFCPVKVKRKKFLQTFTKRTWPAPPLLCHF